MKRNENDKAALAAKVAAKKAAQEAAAGAATGGTGAPVPRKKTAAKADDSLDALLSAGLKKTAKA
jgi:hypothetical protein